MRVRVISPTRWTAEGVVAAVQAMAPPSPLCARAATPDEPLPAGAERPDVVVVVAGEGPGAAARRMLDHLPPGLPVLWLGDADGDYATFVSDAAHARPFGQLPTHTDDARLHAAIAALGLGLSIYDAGAGAPHRAGMPAAQAQDLREPLTPRELEVFELMAKGLGNRDIGSALGISSHTAKFHVAQILEKTGSATRTEAVRQGLRLGLVGL